MPVLVARVITAAMVLGSAACGSTGGGPDAGPAGVTIGTGQTTFEPLADQDSIFIVQGPQGGYHFLGSFAARGIDPGDPDDLSDPDNPTSEFRVFVGELRRDLAAANRFKQGLESIPGTGAVGTVGRLVILDIQDDDELADVMVRFEVSVTDSRGATAEDAVDLVAVPHPNNL